MKKATFLLSILTLGFVLTEAQVIENQSFKPRPKQELCLNVVSVLTKKQNRLLTDFYFRPDRHETWQVKAHINVGLLYKLERKSIITRFGFTYQSNRVESDYIKNSMKYWYKSEGHSTGIELRYGWEKKNKTKKKLQTKYGIDFFSGYISQKLNIEQSSGWGGRYVGPLNVQILTVGVSPNFGIKYFFTPAFSLGLETHLSIFFINTIKDGSDKGFYNPSLPYLFSHKFTVAKFIEPARFIHIGYHF